MRFKGLDLNLLVALDALLTEPNLTAAARSINLSQPAMSAAVSRLREYFRDELFVMRGRKLVPTSRAAELADPVREALLLIQLSVISRDAFNPMQSVRHFRFCLSDFMMLVFMQKIVKRVALEAPGVSFEFLPLDGDPNELVQRGDVDFLILPEVFLSNGHPKSQLFREKLVCIGCSANERFSVDLSVEEYMAMGHVAVRFGRSRKPSIEEWMLRDLGFNRRNELTVSTFNVVPWMVVGSSRIATVPLGLARHFVQYVPLRIVDLPLPISTFTEAVQWPALQNTDPASIWMRELLLQEASAWRD